MCPECSVWFAREERFDRSLRSRLAAGDPTPLLWDRVLSRSGVARGLPSRRRFIFILSGALAAAAILIASILTLYPFGKSGPSASGEGELGSIASDWHEKWAKGAMRPEMASVSDEEVETYLKSRVPFRVHCPPRKDVNFEVAGAGICTVKDRPAAYIVGQVGQDRISIFVLSRESLEAFPRDRAHLIQGKGRHSCREGAYRMASALTADNLVVVTGAAPMEALERVLRAYGSYPEPL